MTLYPFNGSQSASEGVWKDTGQAFFDGAVLKVKATRVEVRIRKYPSLWYIELRVLTHRLRSRLHLHLRKSIKVAMV